MDLENQINDFVRMRAGIQYPITFVEKDVIKFCEDNNCTERKDEIIKKLLEAQYKDEPIKLI